jgi:hypothetical protein
MTTIDQVLAADLRSYTDPDAIWTAARAVMEGQTYQIVTEQLARVYVRTYRRGGLRTEYLPVAERIMDEGAAAFALPPNVQGGEGYRNLRALVLGHREELDYAWRCRRFVGSHYLHLVRRKGRVAIEPLWGNQVTATPDPDDPTRWESALEVRIHADEDRDIVYARDDAGGWTMHEEVGGASTGARTPIPGLPVLRLRRTYSPYLVPLPDRTVLDIHVGAGLRLSDIEFRRVYRVAQMWRRRSGQAIGAPVSPETPKVDAATDAIIELEADEQVGMVESSLSPGSDLDYLERWLRLAAKILGLPPRMFDPAPRSETGAARAWDYWPEERARQADRAQADEMLVGMLLAWAPILEAWGVPCAGAVVRVVAPPEPPPSDAKQYAEGLRALMGLGLESPAHVKAGEAGVSFAAAEEIVRRNIEQCMAIGLDVVAANESSTTQTGTPIVDGDEEGNAS